MYWKIIRWGGTGLVVLMLILAFLFEKSPTMNPSSHYSGEQGLRLH